MSEAAALSITRKPRGHRGIRYTWRCRDGRDEIAESSYEVQRMRQLDAAGLDWTRCRDRIPYVSASGRLRHYIPDLRVVMPDGTIRVEEIKPDRFVSRLDNPEKFSAASTHYAAAGISFVVITECDLAGTDRALVDRARPDADERKARSTHRRRERIAHQRSLETQAEKDARRFAWAEKARRLRDARQPLTQQEREKRNAQARQNRAKRLARETTSQRTTRRAAHAKRARDRRRKG